MQPRPLILVGILASMVTGVALGVLVYRHWLIDGADAQHARAFERVLREVQQSYVDEVSQEQLVRHAVRGMLQQLDAHSAYLDEGAYEHLQSETSGEFGGVGIELGLVDDHFTVIAPLDGTPAAAAGIVSGDRLLELDRASLAGRRLTDVVRDLRGAPGTHVHLRLQGPDDAAPRDVELTRAVIALSSVSARLLEPGYGYVRISQFQIQTGKAFERALADLAAESEGPLQGLVLDLRNNPGGVLQASVAVADALLTDGLIVYTEGRQRGSRLRFAATGQDLLAGAPVVVLINQGSASAAEVVAGALQDHGRATVLGTRSYGKGSVQSVVPVADGQAIKLTTAHYFTPNGRNIDTTGITPDLERPAAATGASTRGFEDLDSPLLSEALLLLKQGADSLHARL